MAQSQLQEKLDQLLAIKCEERSTPEIAIRLQTIVRLRREGYNGRCLQVGETVPNFEFVDSNNVKQTLYDTLDKGPVILNFFRGFWCSYCRLELEAYEHIQEELAALGCSYFAISPQRPETANRLPENYHVIFDQENEIARNFDIVYMIGQAEIDAFLGRDLKLEQFNDSDCYELPIPATFIIREDRTIGYVYIDVDYRKRCAPEELIEELKSFCD